MRRLGRQGCAVVAAACVLGFVSATPADAVGHERILFARGPEFHTILSLYTARPDGTHLRLLTDDSMFGTISPNGKVVAYTAGADHDVQTTCSRSRSAAESPRASPAILVPRAI